MMYHLRNCHCMDTQRYKIGYNTNVINQVILALLMMNSLEEFVDYVWSFYGGDEPLYPIVGLTKDAIVDAYNIYIERIEKGDLEYVHYSWGGGDSLDRERVRDIILEQPQFSWSC